MNLSEESLHLQIAQLLNLILDPKLTLWTTIENSNQQGGRLGMIKQSKLKHKGVLKGLPDIIIWSEGYIDAPPFTLMLEVKITKGKCTPEQKSLHKLFAAMGIPVFVVRSLKDVKKALEEWNIPHKNIILT